MDNQFYKMRLFVLTYIALFFRILSATAQPGSLDMTFGIGGKMTFLPQPILNKVYGLAQLPDGKILLAGYVQAGSENHFYLTRLLPDGTLDATFGTDGAVEQRIGVDAKCYALALQSDGKILLAGTAQNPTAVAHDFAILRCLPNGQPDSTFSSDGIYTISIASGDDTAHSLAVQPDGKIVLAGTAVGGSNAQLALVRLRPDGVPDPAFSSDGKVTLAIGTFFTEAYDLVLQPEGKIVVAGAAKFGMADDIAVARFSENGNPDIVFGGPKGYITTNLGSDADAANAVTLQADGKILVAGTRGASRDFVLLRYLGNGAQDLEFGNQGVVTTDFEGADDIANDIVVQPDGKILLGGYAYLGGKPKFAMARYTAKGMLDPDFGLGGLTTTDFDDSYDFAFPMILQTDGKILLGGYTFSNGHTAFAVARFISGLTVGVSALQQPELLRIAPNPIAERATFAFKISKDGTYSLELTDVQGRVVQAFFTQKHLASGLHTEILVPNAAVTPGPYFLRLSEGNLAFSVKVLKI